MALGTWTLRTTPTYSSLNGVAYGNNLWVAVSTSGTVLTSSGGSTWTQHTTPTSTTLYGVAYGNGLWVAVGYDGKVITSSDGTTWTQRTTPATTPLYGVAYGNGLWVAVGYNGMVITSSDGITWVQRNSTVSSTVLNAVTYIGGLWVAVGDDGKVIRSSDGITWTQKTPVTTRLVDVAYGNGTLVAVGDDGMVITSSNGGTDWTQRTSSTSNDLLGIAYGDGLWVAVGNSGTVIASSDGATWAQHTTPTSAVLWSVAYNNTVWVAVGDSGMVITNVDNRPPTAPTLITPTNGGAVDWQQPNVFAWQFNDPNPGDSQSAYNLAYRITGAPVWTETGWVTSTATQRTVASGTFTTGDYEWRVQTKDAQGAQSPWSSTGFFTAGDAPPGPTITDPPNGGTIGTAEYLVTWSTTDQDAYQLQVLDGDTVLFDTGQVNQDTARSRLVQFPDNNVTRTIRLRILYGGLWSPWSTATVTVSYTPPPVPWVTATPVDVGAGVPSAIRVDVEDPRLRVDARNRTLNPAAVATGYGAEYLLRYNWQRSWETTGGPANGPETFTRITPSTTGTVDPNRGLDVYGNMDLTPGTSGSWVQQPVTAGQPLTFSVFTRVSKDSPIALRYRIHDGLGVWVTGPGSTAPVTLVANEWQRLDMTITPAVSGYIVFRIEINATGWATTDWLDATGQMLQDGADLQPYFDGGTPADDTYTYRWTGTPHASPSERLAYGTTGELAESTEPMVVAHDVWVRGGPEGEIRLAADLPASLPYLWHLPASGVDYEFRARAIGDNGTSSWSDWTL